MLPKKHRLMLSKDFEILKNQGRRINGPLFNLIVAKRDENQPPRFGFVVSRKIDKKAVRRNRCKRLLREATRPFLSSAKPGYDVLLLAKKPLKEKSFGETEEEMRRMFEKAKLFKSQC